MRLIVTRPQAQAVAWVERLRALGVDAVALPLLAIEPAADPAAVHQAWEGMAGCALVVFVSPNAVQAFFGLRPAAAAWPAGTAAGSTGPGTSEALRAAGVAPTLLIEPAADAPTFDSEALWLRLQDRDWTGRRVLIVRGQQGRDWLTDRLRSRGAVVDRVAAYRRGEPRLDDDARALLAAALAAPARHVWHFSSSEAVAALERLAPGTNWSGARALASHPRIADSARAAGFGRVDPVGVRPEAVATILAAVVAPARAARAGSGTAPPIESDPP